MIRVRSNCGRVVIEIVKETGEILSETMSAPRAREFTHDVTKVCNKIENWNWAPGGGAIHEQVIHVDNAWYPIEEPPKDSREVLITTDGPEGRNIAVGFYVPERETSQGKTLPPAMPKEWYGTTKSLDDIQSAMGPIIAAEVRRAKLKIERGESIFTVPGLFCYGCPERKDFFHSVRGCVTCPFKMAQELEELRKYKAQKEKEVK